MEPAVRDRGPVALLAGRGARRRLILRRGEHLDRERERRPGAQPSRTLWDAQISREGRLGERAHARIAFGATNVFDEDWEVHSRGGFFGGGKVAGPPRQIYMSLQLSL